VLRTLQQADVLGGPPFLGINLFYLFSNRNWYSFAPLIGSLEQRPWFHQVKIQRFRPMIASQLSGPFHAPTIIAYSFSTPQAPSIATEITKLRKQIHPNVLLIAGGAHPSGDPEQTLNLGFDGVIVGEGEKSFPELIYAVKENIPLDNADIPGVIWNLDDGSHIKVEFGPPLNLDQHSSFSKTEHLYPPIEITRGCPYSCAYCQVPNLHPKMRHRSIDRILEIVFTYREIFQKKGRIPTDIRFITPNALAFANSSPQKGFTAIEQLLTEISTLPNTQVFFASFPSEIRPEFLTEETAALIKQYATNQEIVIGGQSASNNLLKAIQRGHTAEIIETAVEIALQYHLIPHVDIIFGLPSETPEDQEQTMKLINSLVKIGAIPRIHHFIPLAGTPFYTKSPSPIKSKYRNQIGRLMRMGKAKGSFEHQMTIAYQVVRFIQSRKKTK